MWKASFSAFFCFYWSDHGLTTMSSMKRMAMEAKKLPLAPSQTRIFDRIILFFKELMENGDLRPGDRLLSERELSSRLGVSRASLREALRALELFGIISIVPGQGSYIVPPNFKSLSSVFELMLSLKPSISENVLEVRILIEIEAVRLATMRATPEELASIRSMLDRMPVSLDGNDFGAQADFEFHKAILEATHNDILIFISETIEGLLRKSHYERRVSLFNIINEREKLVHVHREVYEAIEARDADGAAEKMRQHFAYTNSLIAKSKNMEHN